MSFFVPRHRRVGLMAAVLLSILLSVPVQRALADPITVVSSFAGTSGEIDPAQINNGNGTTSPSQFDKTATDSQSNGATLGPLSASIDLTSSNGSGRSITLTSSAQANWASSTSGTIALDDSWSATNVNIGFISQIGPMWQYTFTPDADGVFTLDFNVQNSGNNSFWFGGFTDPALDGMQGIGQLTFPLSAGVTQTIEIDTFAQELGGIHNDHTDTSGSFSWSMSLQSPPPSVPEPGSLLLLAFGLVALGMTRRSGFARSRGC